MISQKITSLSHASINLLLNEKREVEVPIYPKCNCQKTLQKNNNKKQEKKKQQQQQTPLKTIKYNCQKICSWVRRPETYWKSEKKDPLSWGHQQVHYLQVFQGLLVPGVRIQQALIWTLMQLTFFEMSWKICLTWKAPKTHLQRGTQLGFALLKLWNALFQN